MKGLKKALGQNFFNNPTLADKIVDITTQNNPERIVEIGPGDGYFTTRLLNKCSDITVIEKDSEISEKLKIKFPTIKIINEDFLDLDLRKLKLEDDTVIYGSLPYNISKVIIRRLLEETPVKNFFFIIQKEVAVKYSQLEPSSLQSITTKLFADSKVLLNISPGSFLPRPKVDSSFIQFSRNENSSGINTQLFLELIKRSFSSPRKTLRNNLKGWKLQEKIDPKWLTFRGEQLKIEDFLKIYKEIEMI